MPKKRKKQVYRCKLPANSRYIFCRYEKAGSWCLNLSAWGRCPYLISSHKLEPSREYERVPPLSQSHIQRLIHKVGTRCCYPHCAETEVLEVHHIKPRSEGGTNKESNLVVLCSNHHTKAERGLIPRERLRLYSVARMKKRE